MKWIWACVLATLLAVSVTYAGVASGAPNSRKQKAAAEFKRAKLRKKLKVLKREIKKTERAKDNVANTLAASKTAIAKANRDLRHLSKEQRRTQKQLRKLTSKETRLEITIAEQQKRLARLLRGMHREGDNQHLKLLLSGDNPNRISRELHYMGYVTQAQAHLISQLRANLQAIEQNRVQTQSAKTQLDKIALKKRAKKKVLEKEKARRSALLSRLAKKLTAKRREVKRLQRNQKRMTVLVNRLSRLIAKRKREAAAARKRRKWVKNQKKSTRKQKMLVNRVEPKASNDPKDGVFARQRGRLRLPVRGTITERFGRRKGGGPAHKGLFIRTKRGAKIKAVATGKVVFADWLRGFGNLIIIDHGSDYMTIYGNNQTLYKKEGDAVKTGDVIAVVGNSGSHTHSGLYFEMRRRGRAFDPLRWVTIR